MKTPITIAVWMLACVGVMSFSALAAPTRGLTVDDMLAMQRISDPAVSPDGQRVVFALRTTDVAANRGRFDIAMIDVAGGPLTMLTSHADNDTNPAWSPDGKHVYFLSTRGGSSQVWRIAVGGGEPVAVTSMPIDVNGYRVFPDGKRLLLAMDVFPSSSPAATAARDEELAKSKSKAKVYDALLFRHWDSWEDGKRSHLFVWSPDAPQKPLDLMPGRDADAPTHPFGGMEEVSISPDGNKVAFTMKDAAVDQAWTTNMDVFIAATSGKAKLDNLTADNKAWDGVPVFSPDGKQLALLSMARPQFESDGQRVVLVDMATRNRRVLTQAWDRSAQEIVFSADGKRIFTSADDVGRRGIFAIDVASMNVTTLFRDGNNGDVRIAGNKLVFAHDALSSPAELWTMSMTGTDAQALTHINDARVQSIAWGTAEQFSFVGAKGETVHGYVVKPPQMKATKVPVAFLIHGGPQGSFGDHFHYRWNPQVFAGHGYGAVFIDFHGSTGYGQAFTDSISGDWGGAPYEDLMKGLDAALAKYSWLDGKRVVGLGASYGGFMINWINGQTDRFKSLVCHDGNLDERFAYYDTEELWFPEFEHGGPPWSSNGYAKHNPIDHVAKWKTPTLVIHGGQDFRVVDTQGMATFTALQRRGIRSRFLHFPEENHWILRPQNSQRWHAEVFRWMDETNQ
jgi:dipeptidyl aminopeptidase/acylaminoacyl peptidase